MGSPAIYYPLREAHGILGSLAVIIVLPVGGVVIRTCTFKGAIWVHAGLQLLAYAMLCYVFCAGVWMSVSNDYWLDPHIILGCILFGLTTIQPFLGTTHHMQFNKLGRRTYASYLHMFIGRAIIPMGIINGGLGLRLAFDYMNGELPTYNECKAYGIVGGIMWLAYTFASAYGETKATKSKHWMQEQSGATMQAKQGVEARKLGVYETDSQKS